LFADPDVQRLLRVNRHQGVLWYNREAFEKLLWWLSTTEAILAAPAGERPSEAAEREAVLLALRRASDAAGYQVARLVELVAAE